MKFFISIISWFVSLEISQVVRSLNKETLVAIVWLWRSTKLRSNQLKPHSHLLLISLVLLPIIPILSAVALKCKDSSNFGLWPFSNTIIRYWLFFDIIDLLLGGALTRWGTGADRAIYGSPHNVWIALCHVEQKLLMWQASSAQA